VRVLVTEQDFPERDTVQLIPLGRAPIAQDDGRPERDRLGQAVGEAKMLAPDAFIEPQIGDSWRRTTVTPWRRVSVSAAQRWTSA
jgi:hypothetical protein